MSELLILVSDTDRREVFCRLASIGQQEFYLAQAAKLKPELKFILTDYLDYNNEFICVYEGTVYRVLRTYRSGQELEIVVQLASKEESVLYGKES